MVAHEGQAVFVNFKINLKLNFKFISISISFENQFNFISVFYFKVTSKCFCFIYCFKNLILSMWWSISANTNLAHGLFLDLYECN